MLYVGQTDPWDYIWDNEWLTDEYSWVVSGMEFNFDKVTFNTKDKHNRLVKKLNLEL